MDNFDSDGRLVLGMTELPRPDLGPGYWLDAGGQQVHLMESDTQPLGANHFTIRVDDIDAAVSDLQEQGVEVHRIPFIPGAGHQAFLHDPFGNLLKLNQPLAGCSWPRPAPSGTAPSGRLTGTMNQWVRSVCNSPVPMAGKLGITCVV